MNEPFGYRVLQRDGEVAVYEVFFDETGHPTSCTATPAAATATVDDLRHELEQMLQSLDVAVIDYDQVGSRMKP